VQPFIHPPDRSVRRTGAAPAALERFVQNPERADNKVYISF